MLYLIIVSLIWAFSFGLIKTNLTSIDSNLVALFRLFISFIVFLPFLKIKNLSTKEQIIFISIGTIQYGFMYIAYIYAFQFLKSYEVALFTIFTPIFITFYNDLIKKKFHAKFLIVAVAAVLGAGIVIFKDLSSENIWLGFILMQISNICFAVGQVWYSNVMNGKKEYDNKSIFALLYLGAVIVAFISTMFSVNIGDIQITGEQAITLVYLGAVSSGLAFFLWNVGATKVNKGTLAIFNNLKIPAAILVSVLIFGESGDITRLIIGGGIILTALFLNESKTVKS